LNKTRLIATVGYLVPLGVALLLYFVGKAAWGRFDAVRAERQAVYDKFKVDRLTIQEIAPALPKYQPRLAFFHALLHPDQYGLVGDAYKDVEASLDTLVARRVGYSQMDGGGDLLTGVTIPSTGLTVSWAGKFPQLQSAALQIETERPNLLLTSLNAEYERSSGEDRRINLVEKYIAFSAPRSFSTEAPVAQ